jgi:general secretion pathway protein G
LPNNAIASVTTAHLTIKDWSNMSSFPTEIRHCRFVIGRCAAFLAATVLVHTVRAADPPQSPPPKQSGSDAGADSRFLRVVEVKDKSIALQIVSRTFLRPVGTGPKVTLVGVAHIGDKAFYQSLQKHLDSYDVVLYESVKPPGASRAHGETDQERVASTLASMRFIGGMIQACHMRTGKYPVDLGELRTFATSQDSRLGAFITAAMIDAWNNPLRYERAATEDSATTTPPFSLVSVGADGKPGGEDENADLILALDSLPDSFEMSKDDGIQSQLASSLGLQFQLDAICYDRPNWRCSDMAMDEVNRRLQAKGLDFSLIGGTLAGSSLPAKIIKIMLGLMKLADTFMDGAIADTFKIIMIELLGDERLIDMSLDQLGDGFGEVIVSDRNQVAIDDVKRVIEREPQVKSVAIFYGAAHMPDMVKKLSEQLGYEPAPSEADQWFTAIKVNYSESAVSPAEVRKLRMMMRQMIRQQLRR